jgi:HD-GYP domain-containing protein (c-di-GMP phosphodiesterase class II)
LSASLAVHVSQTETAAAGALLQAVAEIIRLVDEKAILNATLARAIELSAAHTGSIMLREDESGVMRIHASQGLPGDVASQAAVAPGEGIAGWVLSSGKAMVVEDLDDLGPRGRRHGIRSAAAVPIADDEGILGVLNVGCRTFQARFSDTHLNALESLGRVLALALRNARAHAASRDLYLETVKALALALETKDPYSKGATERILTLSTQLGEAVGLGGTELQGLRIAALVHDIGMAAAGDLHSLGDRPLSTVEWGMLKLHPVIAAEVLSQAPSLREAVPIVYHHHEHFDGSGYVQGLAGDDIPLGARVLAVADSYVAMTSPRAYRKAMTTEKAIQELVSGSGTQYDPEVVSALSSILVADRSRS